MLQPCHGSLGNQLWYYHYSAKILQHSQGLCLGVDERHSKLVMEKCEKIPRLQWLFENYNKTKFKEFSKNAFEEKYFKLMKNTM